MQTLEKWKVYLEEELQEVSTTDLFKTKYKCLNTFCKFVISFLNQKKLNELPSLLNDFANFRVLVKNPAVSVDQYRHFCSRTSKITISQENLHQRNEIIFFVGNETQYNHKFDNKFFTRICIEKNHILICIEKSHSNFYTQTCE